MTKIHSFSLGQWVYPKIDEKELFNAVDSSVVGTVSNRGLDFEQMIHYAKTVGNPNLRKLTFHDRAKLLKKLALHLSKYKEEFYEISYKTGATRADSWIDIEGGLGNLFIYAGKGRRELPDKNFFLDGELEQVSKLGTFVGQHIFVPMEGVAIHINAFNFPVWGMLEKIAVNLLAGMPTIVKPATLTCFLTEAVVRRIIDAAVLPEGAIQLVSGSAATILDYVDHNDVITFTGSASTGRMLQSNPIISNRNVRFNMEADSLNCSILGEDALPDTIEFQLFIKEVVREMTVKAGQKCTAIRRVIVPENLVENVESALAKSLDAIVVGNPSNKAVRMGALAGRTQLEEVRERLEELKTDSEVVYEKSLDLVDASSEKGAFMPCVLLRNNKPFQYTKTHDVEAFGPISTIMPYKDKDEAIRLSKMGEGSLVGSIVSHDYDFIRDVVLGIGSQHGRLLVLDRDCAKESTGHGSPLPHLIHGGPGRAGGGEEMGGIRGVKHYMQRVALQGSPTAITKITDVYQPNAKGDVSEKHPFRFYYEDLSIGQTLMTHKRTVTETDVVNFANISGDNFYAHTDTTSLEGTIFEGRVAHGYFVLSAAAGLFVDPGKGPVLANYGIDFCRFLKPVYPGDTIAVKLICKEKIDKEAKNGEQPSGVVKWYAEVVNQQNEVVAIFVILTLVSKKGTSFIELATESVGGYLERLEPSSKPAWGKFTPQQMTEHLLESMETSLGKINAEITTPADRIESMQRSLYNNVPMLKNFQLPHHKDGLPPLKYDSLDKAKKALLEGIEAFYTYYAAHPDSRHNNAIFGNLDFKLWTRLHRKHFTHHFTQFKLI